MGADSQTLMIPARGTIFTSAPNLKPPVNPLAGDSFDITKNGPTGWTNLGHTSKENLIGFTKEGGERESLGTFLAESVRTTQSDVSWGITVNSLQITKETLDLAFAGEFDPKTGGYTVAGGGSKNVGAFIVFQDVTAKLAFWLPSIDMSLGDAPSLDTANFFEFPLSASILSVENTVIPAVNGRAGLFQIFSTSFPAVTA
ncbi:hypothetical protein O1W71_01940 [Microbacterium sp. H37-C3]|uniref:phage tail tube protein n=1 Tax=Microbacterium sp. H37-C3 TaxID=3004354 RepID=UPI0022AF1486|nr:hypothetical protein [Microbacterium sp. H37-C3]MCZ4066429.1 hypothetical protein [Microbacterium sp. H37-C3]